MTVGTPAITVTARCEAAASMPLEAHWPAATLLRGYRPIKKPSQMKDGRHLRKNP